MLKTLAGNWWAIVLRGVCAVLFGLAAFAWPGLTLAVLVLLYGAYAIADGVMAVVWSLFSRREGPFPWGVLLVGLVGLLAGLVALVAPGAVALAFLFLIAGWAIVRGAFEIIAAVQLRREMEGEWLLALSGVLSIGLGLLLLARPGVGVLAVVWWIGAIALVHGILAIILGFKLKGVLNRLT